MNTSAPAVAGQPHHHAPRPLGAGAVLAGGVQCRCGVRCDGGAAQCRAKTDVRTSRSTLAGKMPTLLVGGAPKAEPPSPTETREAEDDDRQELEIGPQRTRFAVGARYPRPSGSIGTGGRDRRLTPPCLSQTPTRFCDS